MATAAPGYASPEARKNFSEIKQSLDALLIQSVMQLRGREFRVVAKDQTEAIAIAVNGITDDPRNATLVELQDTAQNGKHLTWTLDYFIRLPQIRPEVQRIMHNKAVNLTDGAALMKLFENRFPVVQ